MAASIWATLGALGVVDIKRTYDPAALGDGGASTDTVPIAVLHAKGRRPDREPVGGTIDFDHAAS